MYACLVLLLTGCLFKKSEPLPELPPKPISSPVEQKYDELVADRFSKASASVNAIYKLVDKQPDSKDKTVIISETKIARTVLGSPTAIDEKEALDRVQSVLSGANADNTYRKFQEEAVALKEAMKVADQNYENERAKMQSEYNAKLVEREQMLAQEKALRRIDAEEARKDKFMYAGGILFIVGIAISIWVSKHDGVLLSLGGLCLASFGWVLGTPYFYWVLLAFTMLGLIKAGIFLFLQKSKVATDSQNNEPPAPNPNA